MPENVDEGYRSAPAATEQASPPIDFSGTAEALKGGPRGALFVSAIAVGLLFVGWLLFYFLLFLPRGPIG